MVPGGVVNLVSKRPQEEAYHEVVAQVGNFDHRQVALDSTGAVNADKTLLYRVVALARDSGTQVEYADMERQYFAPSLTWKANADTSLNVYAQYQQDESGSTEGFFPLEGTLYPGPNGYIPVERFVSEPGWDTYGGERLRLGYELKHRMNTNWSLEHRLRHDDVEGTHRSLYANYWEGFLSDGRSLNRTWYASDDSGTVTSADLYFTGKFNTGQVRHTLLMGTDVMQQDSERLYWTGAATALDVYTPTYGQWTPPSLTSANTLDTYTGTTDVKQWGVVIQDQLKLGERWVVTASVRQDEVVNDSTLQSGGAGNYVDDRQKDDAVSKNLGMVYLADGGWSPYIGYSESFQPEIGADRNGNNFNPKRGEQVELGVKWAPKTQPVSAVAAVYKLKETGRLTEDPIDPLFSAQLGEVEVQGLELEMYADLERWQMIANFTHTDTEDKESGYHVANVPDKSASLWTVRRLDDIATPGLKAGFGVRHTGETWDGYDALKTDAVTLYDAMVSWQSSNWSVALNITNLTDKTYFAACLDRGDCWYGTQREVVLSAGYNW